MAKLAYAPDFICVTSLEEIMWHITLYPKVLYKDILCSVWKNELGTIYLTRSPEDTDATKWYEKAMSYGFYEMHYGLIGLIIEDLNEITIL
ncbi:MAG: hypothetical protein J5724_05270 [Ruminococcus sp.]|nr:hypothetical protein [Ruminococcus sp.]